jgi:hypothetical protein
MDSLDQDPPAMIQRFRFAALCFLGPLTCVAHGGKYGTIPFHLG